MDHLLNIFSLSLHTQEERDAAAALQRAYGIPSAVMPFNDALEQIKQRYPNATQTDWFGSTVHAILGYMLSPAFAGTLDTRNKRIPFNGFDTFMRDALITLNGGKRFYLSDFRPALSHFTKKALAQPHFQWAPILVERINAINSLKPGYRHTLKVASIHPHHQISDTTLLSLHAEFARDEWDLVMTYSEYVELYVQSRTHFLVENTTLEPEVADSMRATLRTWARTHGVSEDAKKEYVYDLGRNFEVHPHHEPFIVKFVEQTLVTEQKTDS